ncbi:MAG: ferredoxin, partial [Sphingomonadales bacterium]|nr:ferredoxin [Sphingomonadales bacterium]
MAKLTIVNRAGEETAIEGDTGLTVMENIRDNGFDELLALCGGCCS